jgi:hypothetical protein
MSIKPAHWELAGISDKFRRLAPDTSVLFSVFVLAVSRIHGGQGFSLFTLPRIFASTRLLRVGTPVCTSGG